MYLTETLTDRQVHCPNCGWEGETSVWVGPFEMVGECPKCLAEILVEIDD